MTDTSPRPTPRDTEIASVRAEIASRQAEAYGQVLRWAMGVFGPGWLPSGRHYLASKEAEERHRATGEPITPVATVYTVEHQESGVRRYFTVEGGKVKECASYQEGFGDLLLAPDESRTIEVRRQLVHPHKFSLCWAGYEPGYRPMTPEQLAAARARRQERAVEREAKGSLFAEQIREEGFVQKRRGRGK